jgi:hypothetical protein
MFALKGSFRVFRDRDAVQSNKQTAGHDLSSSLDTQCFVIKVVPHKAVAEVSKIGNL